MKMILWFVAYGWIIVTGSSHWGKFYLGYSA